MISNNNIIPIFPEAVLYATTIDVDSNKLLNFCKNSSFDFTESSKNKNSNCFASNNLNVFEELIDLKNAIEKNIKYYLFEILKYKMDYKFLNSWVTKTGFGGYSQPHTHCNTFLSGVYYPVGHENFKIRFLKKEPGFWDIETTEVNIFNIKSLYINITENNTLLLFPSSLKHKIEKNDSNIERYSIAFNVNPKGEIGNGDSKILF
jgi:uncharacterized protein (TIGR02466 family)